jgi:hypothetical protein
MGRRFRAAARHLLTKMGVALLLSAAVVCTLAYAASVVITWVSGRSALYSICVAITMSVGFVLLAELAASVWQASR